VHEAAVLGQKEVEVFAPTAQRAQLVALTAEKHPGMALAVVEHAEVPVAAVPS